MTELINPYLAPIITLTGPTAVVVYLIMIGYAAKMISWIPNRFIPFINFAFGPILGILLVAWPVDTDMPPGVRYPEITAWLTAILRGFLMACTAWVLHARVLRNIIDDKVVQLNGKDKELRNGDSNVSPSSTIDHGAYNEYSETKPPLP
jgi:hypothetical protein